ncbi:MAG TPA: LapA family protein [Actinophytocola sp.]|nr:LapA family protein [Actinophytocola sp.]
MTHAKPPDRGGPGQRPLAPPEQPPATRPPVERTRVEGAPLEGAPAQRTPVEQTPIDRTPIDRTPAQPAAGTEPPKQRGRVGAVWWGLIIAAVVLVLILVFVIQNSQTVEVSYFGWQGRLSLAVAMLLGVAAGALLVVIPGTVRILRLRNKVRHPR